MSFDNRPRDIVDEKTLSVAAITLKTAESLKNSGPSGGESFRGRAASGGLKRRNRSGMIRRPDTRTGPRRIGAEEVPWNPIKRQH